MSIFDFENGWHSMPISAATTLLGQFSPRKMPFHNFHADNTSKADPIACCGYLGVRSWLLLSWKIRHL